jgi:hypothetical protein
MDQTRYPKLFSKYGCWVVNNQGFLKKLDAFQYASKLGNDQIFFYYHNHIWENFDRSLLGKVSLKNLYKQRAEQLRDRYQYLVLHFSGGSDSFNILSTFLKNNIKLDEIVVKWPKILSEKNFYIPNDIDTSAKNALSEWDYAISPVLKKLSIHNPEIKITIVDYTENFISDRIVNNLEKKLENNYFYSNYTTAVFFMTADTDKFDVTYKSENTGHIFGIEKPTLSYGLDGIYLHFADHAFDMLAVNPEIGIKEPFYWSADLPILPMEQAYQCALYIASNPSLIPFLYNNTLASAADGNNIMKMQNKIFKEILYKESWNFNTFQAEKPDQDRHDWYRWMYEVSDFEKARLIFLENIKDITNTIDFSLFQNKTNINNGLRKLKTKGFKILDF